MQSTGRSSTKIPALLLNMVVKVAVSIFLPWTMASESRGLMVALERKLIKFNSSLIKVDFFRDCGPESSVFSDISPSTGRHSSAFGGNGGHPFGWNQPGYALTWFLGRR
jgi:hypothetical protein